MGQMTFNFETEEKKPEKKVCGKNNGYFMTVSNPFNDADKSRLL